MNNILPFEFSEVPVELDAATWRQIDKLADRDKKSRHEIIAYALDVYVADFEVGEDLLADIEERISSAREDKPKLRALKIWRQRIEKMLYRFTKNPNRD